MYQENALSDNISPTLALLAEKHLGLSVSTIDFIHIKESQHETYLADIIDNKFYFDQRIDDMIKKLPISYIYVIVYYTYGPKKLKTWHVI